MGIVLEKFDFTGAIGAMICLCQRQAVTADGATQQALDEISASLNYVAGIVARRGLGALLDGPIPPAPVRHEVGEDAHEVGEEDVEEGLSVEEEAVVSGPERRRSPRSMFADLNGDRGAAPVLSSGHVRIVDYIRANPGCTLAEIGAGCGYGFDSVAAMLTQVRKVVPIVSRGRGRGAPARYSVSV